MGLALAFGERLEFSSESILLPSLKQDVRQSGCLKVIDRLDGSHHLIVPVVYSDARSRISQAEDLGEFSISDVGKAAETAGHKLLAIGEIIWRLLRVGLDLLRCARVARGLGWRVALAGLGVGLCTIIVVHVTLVISGCIATLLFTRNPAWTAIVLAIGMAIVVPLTKIPSAPFDFVGDVTSYVGDTRHREALHAWILAITASLRESGVNQVVWIAHSLGSVAASHALMRSGPHVGESRVSLVTLGSPLLVLAGAFPTIVRAPRDLVGSMIGNKIAFWANLWRTSDVIGRALNLSVHGIYEDVHLGRGGHTSYWSDPRVCEWIGRFVILQESVTRDLTKDRAQPAPVRIAISSRIGLTAVLLAATCLLAIGACMTAAVVEYGPRFARGTWEASQVLAEQQEARRKAESKGAWYWLKMIFGWGMLTFGGVLCVLIDRGGFSYWRLIVGIAAIAVAAFIGSELDARLVPALGIGCVAIVYAGRQSLGLLRHGRARPAQAYIEADGRVADELTLCLPDGTCRRVAVKFHFHSKSLVSKGHADVFLPRDVSSVEVLLDGYQSVKWDVRLDFASLRFRHQSPPA